MNSYLYSLGIIFLGLILGYSIQFLSRKNYLSFPKEIGIVRKNIQKIVLLLINPVTFIGAIWVVNLSDLKIIALPFLGISALVLGGLVAWFFSRILKMNRKRTGTYIVAGWFTNIGSIGGLLCYFILGETGFALVPLYSLFELISYFGFGFPIAKSFSTNVTEIDNYKERVIKFVKDPYMLVAVISICIGFILNLSGLKRPDIYDSINAFFIPFGSILLLISIGMAIKFGRIGNYIKESLIIALIKFVLVPGVTTFLAFMVGFGEIDQGLPLKTVLILSSMPVGFIALIPPTIYDLDIDLANAAWIVTNLSLLMVIPYLHYLISLF